MVTLADTSKWIDHLRQPDKNFDGLLQSGQVVMHPFVIGELALGSIGDRNLFLKYLSDLPAIKTLQHEEVLSFIAARSLFGRGIGYVDAHLLVSVQFTPGALLWSHDRRLRAIAEELHLSFVN